MCQCNEEIREGAVWLTLGNVNCVACKTSSLPDKTALFRHERCRLAADQLVGHRLLAVLVELVLIRNIPRPAGSTVIVGLCLGDIRKLGLRDGKAVAPLVLFMANRVRRADCIGLEDGVLLAVNIGIDSETEEMLVVVGIDAGIHFSPVAL